MAKKKTIISSTLDLLDELADLKEITNDTSIVVSSRIDSRDHKVLVAIADHFDVKKSFIVRKALENFIFDAASELDLLYPDHSHLLKTDISGIKEYEKQQKAKSKLYK